MLRYLILGPCAAESQSVLREAAQTVKNQALSLPKEVQVIFRAGAWKPRTKPGCFEGVGREALSWLTEIQAGYGLRVATEVATAEQTAEALDAGICVLWLGARTTTNPFLVRDIAETISSAATTRPQDLLVLVKNPVSVDLALWEGAIQRLAEVVGRANVVAVHRGFTGESAVMRNKPGWSVALQLHRRMPDIPLLLDPSHMAGDVRLVPSLVRKAVELNYDGLMLEMHPRPQEALSDVGQQLSPEELREVLSDRCLPFCSGSEGADKDAGTSLAAYRAEIDELDDELWQLVLRRAELSSAIGAYKRAHSMPVLQPDRWQQLVTRRLAWAEENGLSEETTMRILDALHEESRRRQK